ncbi:MAG: sortase [Chloroflexi bacterium]|nr:sortase [Chloroflexota bacterium]
MSVQSPSESDEKRVPLGIVFLVIGFIILGVVLTIWVLKPAMMPQPLYDLASGFLPRTIPTPVAPVAAPDIPALLPEMPTQDDDEMPDYFISAAEAAQRDPDVGEPVRIVIPQINLDAPVSEIGLEQIDSAGQTYYQWMVPGGYTAGWHDNSARLGEPGNTVLNGHHNIHGEVFRDLVDLEEGDEIILHDASQTYIYQVTVKEILPESNQPLSVRVENAQWIAPTDDERVTLVTCWPYTDNSHRLVIVAEPVEETDL